MQEELSEMKQKIREQAPSLKVSLENLSIDLN